MTARIVVFDTETASLEGGICDIAVVEVDANFNEVDSIESLIDPQIKISPSAMGVHHITNEMVADAPTLDEFVELYGNPFDHQDLIVCGHKVAFDCKVTAKLLPEKYRSICSLKLARQLYPESENHQLQTMRYTFGLEAGTSHRAMGDVITCLSFLRHISKELGTDAYGLAERMSLPISMDMQMQFGKHRGDKLRDLPSGYMQWCLKQDDFDPELLEAFRAHLSRGK